MFGKKNLYNLNVLELYVENDENFKSTLSEIMKITGKQEAVCKKILFANILNKYDFYDDYEKSELDFYEYSIQFSKKFMLTKEEAKETLVDIIFNKVPMRSIYCLEANWNKELAIKIIMSYTGFDYSTCKNKLNKMIYECGLNTAKYRIEKSYDQEVGIQDKNNIASCPKCGSTSITTTNKKISVGKGVAGAAVGSLVNPVGTVVGAAVGATHSKKIYNVCMNCGHRWKP